MRIAFYSPLKPPDHDVPSGDRRMARAMVAALEHGGHDVELASRLRAWARTPADQPEIEAAGRREADRLVRQYKRDGAKMVPELWFTYHLYYRAPDWIGPAVAHALGIPYVVAEASFAMKRATGPWSPGHDAVAATLAHAKVVFALKDGDIPGLGKVKGFTAGIVPLPPFLEHGFLVGSGAATEIFTGGAKGPVLLAVAMMRARAKLDSYRFLALALKGLLDQSWTLIIAGDGPVRDEVEAAFADFPPGRVQFVGAIGSGEMAGLYAAADLFVWPGIDEAYGMVYLEAQSAGVPVVAAASGGVHNVVVDGVSGRLVEPVDPVAYGRAVKSLLDQPQERYAMGQRAARFVRHDRSVDAASAIINGALRHLGLEPGNQGEV